MKNSTSFDVIIVGGGLAGLTNAIHLSQKKIKVLLIEKETFPKHKVCGEYISNEVLPYLNSLGINPFQHGAKQLDTLELTTRNNKKVTTKLPLGGFGMSRYFLDFLLLQKATSLGCVVKEKMVINIEFKESSFIVYTKEQKQYSAQFVIGCFGKRSNLDKKFNRNFIQKKSPFLAVKTHVRGKFLDNVVALHNFKGGYCGVSKVENDCINLCYITDYQSFKKFKSIEDFQENILYKNKELKTVFNSSKPEFKEPLTISQISFESKPLIENHLLMCGDAAAMIHPLCGNGMGMAISSAQIVSSLLVDFYNGKITSRNQLEKMYISQWNKQFKKRLFVGRKIAALFKNNFATLIVWQLVYWFPSILTSIIKKTHGKEIPPI